jgi:hypothetical protein
MYSDILVEAENSCFVILMPVHVDERYASVVVDRDSAIQHQAAVDERHLDSCNQLE